MKVSQKSCFIWNTIGTAINTAMSLIYMIVVAKINDEGASGMFTVCFSLSIILYTFANLGTRVYEVSDLESNDGKYIILKYFTSALSIVASLIICLILKYEIIKTAIVLGLMLTRFFESLSDSLYAVFQKNDRLDIVGKSYSIKNIACLIIFIIVDFATKSVVIATFSMAAVTLLIYFIYDFRLQKKFTKLILNFDIKEAFSLWKLIWSFVVFTLVTVAISNVPRLIADTSYNETEMYYFSLLMMIPTVMALLGQLIVQPALNGLNHNFVDRKYGDFSASVRKILLIMAACAVLCSVGAYFLGPPVLGILTQNSLTEYRLTMVIAIVAGLFSIFTSFISMLLTIMHKNRQQLIMYSCLLVIEIIAIYIGVIKTDMKNIFIIYMLIIALQFAIFYIYYKLSFRKITKE